MSGGDEQSAETGAAEVRRFNAFTPIGTPVAYWPGDNASDGYRSVTRSRAWLIGGHTPVVMVEGYAGGIALTHISTLPTDEALGIEVGSVLLTDIERAAFRSTRMTPYEDGKGGWLWRDSTDPEREAVVERIIAARTDATALEFGTLGWNACAKAMRDLIAVGTGVTVSVFDIEDMLSAAEDEA